MQLVRPFGVRETHGILLLPGNQITATSDGSRWTSLYASAQRESPYEGNFAPVRDQLLVLHRDGPVRLASARGASFCDRVVPAGAIHLIPGGVDFGVRLGGTLSTLHVYVRRDVIEEVAAEMLAGDPSKLEIPPTIVESDSCLTGLLNSVASALGHDDTATAMFSDYLGRAIAAQLVRTYAGRWVRDRRAPGVTGVVSPTVADAIEFMRNNLDQQIGLAEIANACHRSPSHFARIFKTDLGMPPHRFLIQLRIEKAKALLERTSKSIAEIAFESGFSHQEHMTRLFRKVSGTTPAAFRRIKRN